MTQVAQWNSECCQRAGRYKERFSQLKSAVGSKVIAPIHTPWDSGYFIISPHQKVALCWLHTFCMPSLSLCQTKRCGWMFMYVAKIHTTLIRFLDFTNGGSFLKVTLWNKYSVSLSFLWSEQVCGSELCFQKVGRNKRWHPLIPSLRSLLHPWYFPTAYQSLFFFWLVFSSFCTLYWSHH